MLSAPVGAQERADPCGDHNEGLRALLLGLGDMDFSDTSPGGGTGSRQVHVTSTVSPCPSAPDCPSSDRALPSPAAPQPAQSKKSCGGLPARWPGRPTSLPPGPSATLTILPESLTGNYEEAGAHLQEALRPTPPSEVAQARRGLLGLKKGDVPAAARDLQCLVETDTGDLSFLLRLLEASERQSLAQVCAVAQGAPTSAPPQHHEHFGQLCIPCVLISGGCGEGGVVSHRHPGVTISS